MRQDSLSLSINIKTFDLDGLKLLTPEKFVDERGFFSEVLRDDWKEFFDGQLPKQTNLSKSYPGIIRAWHKHERGQIDYFMVLKGSLKICAYDDDKKSPSYGKLVEIIVSEDKLQILRVPGKYWHGTKTISNKPSLTVYFVNNLYDYNNPDEKRRPWNDQSIIDPKTKKPYDWNIPPHK